MSVLVRFLIVVVLLLTPAAASAQRATTGTVSGKVVDSSGAVLPGATITLHSPATLGQFSTVSDANGFFRVANLPPATAPTLKISQIRITRNHFDRHQ